MAPVLLLTAMIEFNPNWNASSDLFRGLAPALMAQPDAVNSYCGAPCDYDSNRNMTFWGLWLLRVSPEDGWRPAWYDGIVAAVVVVAAVFAALVFAVMVQRRKHQALLQALLPKELLEEAMAHSVDSFGPARIRQAETPADLLMRMMTDLLEGRQAELRDIVFIRTALLRHMDLYQPLNLKSHLKRANLDVDVTQALMRQLGALTSVDGNNECMAPPGDAFPVIVDSEGTALMQRTDDDTAGGLLRRRPSAPTHSSLPDCNTLGSALAFLLSPTVAPPAPVVTVRDVCFQPQRPPSVHVTAHPSTAAAPASADASSLSLVRVELLPLTLDAAAVPSDGVSCHGSSTNARAEVEKFLSKADEWHFNTWQLQELTQGHALSILSFYLLHREGLISHFRLNPVALARFLRTVEGGYSPSNPYHNATHAADVLQTLHVTIHGAKLHVHYLDKLGLLAAYLAAIIHDHAHPGLTNDFLIASADPLAVRYNDRSPLENHHCASAFALMTPPNSELDFLAPLPQVDRSALRKQVIELVMATDMKQHFTILSHFNTMHRLSSYAQGSRPRPPSCDYDAAGTGLAKDATEAPAPCPIDDTERLLTLQVALKCADIGHLGEELDVHIQWLQALEEEFYKQGRRRASVPLGS
ncbi:hypothetical protein GPECTOR_2g1206 [Gonium pectorale]|uniref:PDEase domain-containing protein n=1 Tax=Gonium pectorale TaxID=33097 RepID=A0A150H0G0_GONPE|nr:hypothetical protein GPECTOR_2g1206 [Gonium pectorale]|eukprot:KXZ55656.1 hypothetical protein GPECTOR_2g1206 [Gonium pectorale]